MAERTYTKDPDAVLDYAWDWSAWLVADTITGTPTVTVPSGLTKDSQSNDDDTVTVWLSGGTAGTEYEVGCRVTTAGGRTDERTILIQVRER